MIHMLASFAFALFATAALAAQAAPARAGAADAKAITITGCLNSGSSGFVISNVLAARPAGEKGAPATAGGVSLADAYTLVPREGVALAPHVGHRVEIAGSVLEGASKEDDAAAAKGRASRGPDARFAVTSVKMISPVCIQ